jgi:hypothetical protein
MVIYALMIFRLSGIISIFWLSDTSYWKRWYAKAIIILISLVQTGIAVYGISELAQAIAKASSLSS